MNLITISAAGALIFAAYHIVVSFLLRLLALKFSDKPWAQGLATIVS